MIATEVVIGQFGDHTATRGTFDEAFHDKERLVDLLHSTSILANGSGDGSDAHRTTLELIDNGEQDLVVDFIETILVDVQSCEGNICDFSVDLAIALTWAKSRTRRKRALAIRGVPLERPAISNAASSVMGTPKILAERSMICCSVSGS